MRSPLPWFDDTVLHEEDHEPGELAADEDDQAVLAAPRQADGVEWGRPRPTP